MYALGKHILVDLRDCSPEILRELDQVKDALVQAAKEASATVVDFSFHEFNPFGISGMVIIAESHLSIHTWPEYNFAAADIFTCGDVIDPTRAANYLIERFQSKNPTVMEMKRGILSPFTARLPHKVNPEETEKSYF